MIYNQSNLLFIHFWFTQESDKVSIFKVSSVFPVLLTTLILGNGLQLVVGLSQKGLVEWEFSAVHSLEVGVLSSNLLHEVGGIVLIDRFDTFFQPSFFLVIIFLILVPHFSLYINISLLICFSLSFFNHLLIQEISHFFLVILDSIESLLFHVSLVGFSFFFVSGNHLVLPLLLLIHLVEYVISHFVHEFLSSSFSILHFFSSVILLFIKHSWVFILSLKIFQSLPFLIILLSLLVGFVFDQHLLEIVTLLFSLFHLHLLFGFHFTSESIDVVLFLIKLLLFLLSTSSSFLSQLLISCVFIALNLHVV